MNKCKVIAVTNPRCCRWWCRHHCRGHPYLLSFVNLLWVREPPHRGIPPPKATDNSRFLCRESYSIVWVCWVYPVFNSHFNTPLEIKKWTLDFVNFL